MTNYPLRLNALIILTLICSRMFATVGGPTYFDILGLDKEKNALYFVKTIWAECDCNPELYVYFIDNDSLVVKKDWVKRHDYNRKEDRIKVIKEKGLDYLEKIDTVSYINNDLFTFTWQEPVKIYNQVIMKDTLNYPFRLEFGNRYFEYVMCLSQDKKLEIKKYELKGDIGFVFCRYLGKCGEGNTIDEVIIYKIEKDKILSRELNINDRLKESN